MLSIRPIKLVSLIPLAMVIALGSVKPAFAILEQEIICSTCIATATTEPTYVIGSISFAEGTPIGEIIDLNDYPQFAPVITIAGIEAGGYVGQALMSIAVVGTIQFTTAQPFTPTMFDVTATFDAGTMAMAAFTTNDYNCLPGGIVSCDVAFAMRNLLPEGEITIQPVPEPGSLALFGTGLLALGLFGWRRRKAA